MTAIANSSPFTAEIFCALGADGGDAPYVVVKGRFAAGPERGLVPADPPPLQYAPAYHGLPGESSLRYESDLAPFKPATDLVLMGHAVAPGGKETSQVDVTLSAGPITKTVRVFGERVWRKGIGGWEAVSLRPFTRMPLVYERAFGGAAPGENGPWEPANPVGRGMGKMFDPGDPRQTLLPNLEDPRRPLQAPGDRVPVQGFGFIDRTWEPRIRYAGTCDEAWRRDRFPLPPADFDERFFQAAHPDLVAKGYFQGDEAVAVANVTPEGTWRFRLPGVVPGIGVQYGNRGGRFLGNLDTVVILPDEKQVDLVWRRRIPVSRSFSEIRRIAVFSLTLDQAQGVGHLLTDEDLPA